MNIVMDTHIFYWYINQDSQLDRHIKTALDNADKLFVSSATCVELGLLVDKGRIELDTPYLEWFDEVLSDTDIEFLDISPNIANLSTILPEHHKDLVDRLIIATALIHGCDLASVDTKFPLYQELNNKLIH